MKAIQRMFAKSKAQPDDNIGPSDDLPRSSNARRRRSTHRRTSVSEMEIDDVQYKSVVDAGIHASDSVMEKTKHGTYYEFRTTWRQPYELYKTCSRYTVVRDTIDHAGFGFIFKNKMPNSDRTVVEACIRRWWDTTHTFHLPTCEIGLTPMDFTMLSGISVGGQDKITLPPYTDGEFISDPTKAKVFVLQYLPNFVGDISSGAIRSSDLHCYITLSIDHLSSVTIARAFIFYILGTVFFPNASNTCNLGWLNYLIDMEVVCDYDWGSAILARIYSNLDELSRLTYRSVNCFWQVIEFFFYEHMATVCPILRDPRPEVWPRIFRWRKDNIAKKGSVRHKFDVAIAQLEMRSIQSIDWQPYSSEQRYYQYPPNQISINTSSLRYILLDPQLGGYWYLGDRCCLQIFHSYGIPADPPQQMGRISRNMFDQYACNGWPNAQTFFKQASRDEYIAYWHSVSRGPTLPPLSRGVNTDIIGYASLVGSDVEIPCTPHQLQGGVYNMQGASSSSQPPILDWSYQICAPNADIINVPLQRNLEGLEVPQANSLTKGNWRKMYLESIALNRELKQTLLQKSIEALTGTQPYYHNPTQRLDDD